MLRRMMVIAAATAAVLVVGAAPVGAQQYPPSNNSVTVDDVTPHPCQSVTITAGTYSAGSTVEFTLASTPTSLGSATADANGVATLTAAIPDGTEPGDHTITASGTSDAGPLSQTVTVDVSGNCAGEVTTLTPAGASGPLPKTGSNSTMPLARAAALLMAVGGVLLLATRRRRAEARAH